MYHFNIIDLRLKHDPALYHHTSAAPWTLSEGQLSLFEHACVYGASGNVLQVEEGFEYHKKYVTMMHPAGESLSLAFCWQEDLPVLVLLAMCPP